MRVLKEIFKSLLILLILALVGGLIAREVLLLIGLHRVKSTLLKAKNASKDTAYIAECSSRGSRRNDRGDYFQTQLRFVNDQDYVLEIVCSGRNENVITLEKESLPPLVKKLPGHSGLVWESDQTAVNLGCLRRTGSVKIKQAMLVVDLKPAEVAIGSGPAAACSSFGFSCCDSRFQQGLEYQILKASDCPQSCFRVCQDRPLVLSFTTTPLYTPINRTVELAAGEELRFNFVVSPNQEDSFAGMYQDEMHWIEKLLNQITGIVNPGFNGEDQAVTVLDFGDGEQQTFDELTGRASHRYQCSQNRCEYTARLLVENSQGVESYQGHHNRVKVVVR